MKQKDTYTEVFLKAAGKEINESIIKSHKSQWWYNTRDKEKGGLRITDQCLEFITTEAEIKIYEIPLPDDIKIAPQILIWLDQFIDSPYHLSKRHITVLKEKTAFELYLFSGDVRKMGMAKAMSKAAGQDSST